MAKSANTIAIGTKMAAAFPGLQDRLEHLTSAPVITPADVVEGEKLEDDEAEAPIPPTIVGDGDDVAERTLPELAIVDDGSTAVAATNRVLDDDRRFMELVKEPEPRMYILELPLCPDAVVLKVVWEFESVFDVELVDVESSGGPKAPVGDAGNGGETDMLEGSPD